jgi:hypothetical protein
MSRPSGLQPYPREPETYIAEHSLFPKLNPPLDYSTIQTAIKAAFERMKKTRKGKERDSLDEPAKLVKACLKHLKERNDPVIMASFFSKVDAKDVFEMDAVSYEMQRYRMLMGQFYQYLLLELMRAASKVKDSPFINASDGKREGDVEADIRPRGYSQMRLYISVKKSSDTVGGQDLGDAIKRLERVAKDDQNRNSPYLCAIAIANPTKGKIADYKTSRQIKYNSSGNPYSWNCELWGPGFFFPYVTGRTASDIYREAAKLVGDHLPFYSLKFRKESSELLVKELTRRGIADQQGRVIIDKMFEYMVKDVDTAGLGWSAL